MILRVLTLEPETLIAGQYSASQPDSGSSGTLTHLRFALATADRQALQAGAILEFVLRVPAGEVMVEGWRETISEWSLLLDATVSGTGMRDLWWRSGWIEPFYDLAFLGTDNRVRLSVTPGNRRKWKVPETFQAFRDPSQQYGEFHSCLERYDDSEKKWHARGKRLRFRLVGG